MLDCNKNLTFQLIIFILFLPLFNKTHTMEINKKIFFDEYRKTLDKDGKLTQKEVQDIDLFIDMTNHQRGFFNLELWAYVFATTFHETAHTFRCVIEAFNKSEDWRKENLRYYPFVGRGYPQLTWEKNYEKFGKILGLDLVKHPELTLIPENSFKILIIGCRDGLFTGVSLADCVENGVPNYKKMRKVINGTDKADLIAGYAEQFLKILKLATK